MINTFINSVIIKFKFFHTFSMFLSQKLIKHIKCSFRLIHWYHMTSIKDSKECKIIYRFVSSICICSNCPVFISRFLEFSLTWPFSFMSPFFTTSPVTDEIFVSTVYKNLDFLFKKIGNIILKTCHPITKKEGMNSHITVLESRHSIFRV